MADSTNIANIASVLTGVTGLIGGIVAAYFGYRAKVGAQQVDGTTAVEVKRLDNAALNENHLWDYIKERDRQIAELTDELAGKTGQLARAEARIIVLEAHVQENPDSAKPHRILLVDDYGDFTKMVCLMLREEPYEIQTAKSGRVALSLYEQAAATGHPFDLLVLDIRMPEMSGIDVAKAVRANGDDKTRIVWLTANPDLAIERDERNTVLRNYTQEYGVRDTIAKPIDPGDLKNRIRQALE